MAVLTPKSDFTSHYNPAPIMVYTTSYKKEFTFTFKIST